MAKLQASAVFGRALDDNADSLSGALWKTYDAGTTTQATTYSNALLTVANAWPLVADAAGRFPDIYVAPGSYKIRLETSAGALVAESDNNVVYGIDPGEVAVAKFKTVPLMLADETMGYSLGGSVSVVVTTGDRVQVGDFWYEVLASGASDEDLTTAGGVKLRALALPGQAYSPRQFGAISDGTDGSPTDNATACQAAIDAASVSEARTVLWDGLFAFGTTLNITTAGLVINGSGGSSDGSTLSSSAMIWTGGASEMLAVSASKLQFRDFSVENRGTATDWIKASASFQRSIFERLYIDETSNHTQFSNAVIDCPSNFGGYSSFCDIVATQPAPIFLDVDGNGTANAMVPLDFKNCMFFSSTSAFTVLKVEDETIESVTFDDCHLVSQASGNLVVVDTTAAPLSVAINSLTINNCEMEQNNTTAGHRLFKLENIPNIAWIGCRVTGTGTASQHIASIENSNVVEFSGNYWSRVATDFFEDLGGCHVTTGANWKDNSNTEGVGGSSVVNLTYATVMVIDGQAVAAHQHGVFVASITNNSAYQFRCGVAKPYYMHPGQVFSVVVKNVSGGSIAQTSFTNQFVTNGPYTAPANGNQKAFTFWFDGTNAILLSEGAEVANS